MAYQGGGGYNQEHKLEMDELPAGGNVSYHDLLLYAHHGF